MKSPQIFASLLMLFLALNVSSQTTTLNTFPSAVYLENGLTGTQETLHADTHQILLQALKAAGLEDVLDVSGPFTVFAPTNSAFAKLSPDELEELFNEGNRKKLKDILTYHIVAGNFTASKILKAMCRGEGKASFTTVQGKKIFATMEGTDIVLTDGMGNEAKITTADSGHANGVIHQIDSVIVPPGL